MGNAVMKVGPLPAAPLDAAAQFHAAQVPNARALVAGNDAIAILFEAAGHEHRAWRLAAVQELAREAAPCRVNAVAGGDDAAREEAVAYLERAPGVTGQLLALDDNSGELR